jgi:hypothetical protein
VRNFLAIAALHEASMLAVSLLLAVVNGPRCKLARSYGVLSLIYVPTEANIPILEARSRFKIIVKVVPVGGMPSIRTSYSKSAPEAARTAGYEGSSLKSNATKRAASPRVRERVAELQAALTERVAMTSEILIERAEQARQMAMQLKKPGEAIRAIETIAKLCGLWKEKPDAHNQFNGPVTFEVHYTRESVSNEPHPHTIELQGSSAV